MHYNSVEEWKAHKEQKYKETFEALRTIIQNSNGSLDDAIEASLYMVCTDVKAEAGTFWFYSKYGDGLIHPRAQFGGKTLENFYLNLGEGIAGQVIQSGRPTVVRNAQSNQYWESKIDNKTGFVTKSMLCVPLSTPDGIFGCIQLLNKKDGTLFDADDSELASVLAEEIANQFYNLNLLSDGKTEEKVAVLFADVRGFTKISKNLAPSQIAEIANRYFAFMTKCIKETGGVPNKYIGDCAMAYWNDNSETNVALLACRTAKLMINNKDSFIIAVKEKFGVDIEFGIGINIGEAFIGNIGTPVLSDHTVIGDTVNTASFLETCAPANTIYISGAVLEEIKNNAIVANVKKESLKSHKVDCDVYELIEII